MLPRRGGRESLDPGRPDLIVVAASFDDAEACSEALLRPVGGAPLPDPAREAVLRHRLELPAAAVPGVIAVAAQEDYRPLEPIPEPVAGMVALALQRVQLVDALHCSQERSRMVGLAQRNDGNCLGWEVLQPLSLQPGADSLRKES